MFKRLLVVIFSSTLLLGCTASSTDLVKLYKKVSPSVARVFIQDPDTKEFIYEGTGFLAQDSSKVFTARHVVEEGSKFFITFEEKAPKIEVLKVFKSEKNDFAVLTIPPTTLTPLKFAKENPEIGTQVFIIGNPVDIPKVFSLGIVNNYSRNEKNEDVLGTSAPIMPGDSGAPLFTEDGKVVGIMVFIRLIQLPVTKLFYAVPIKEILKEKDDFSGK